MILTFTSLFQSSTFILALLWQLLNAHFYFYYILENIYCYILKLAQMLNCEMVFSSVLIVKERFSRDST